MFASLRIYNYRWWFFSTLVGSIGTWLQRVAQDWFVYAFLTADSPLAIGVVTALQFAPMLLLSPYAGLLADRVNRRLLLAATQLGAALTALGLGVLVLTDTAQLWHVYVFALLLGVIVAFEAPVRQTFVAELVPGELLPNAVGLNSAAFNVARLVGPAAAGLAIEAIGPGWVFIANGLSFLVTLAALFAIRARELYPVAQAERVKGQLRAGVRYVRQRPDIIVMTVIVSVVCGLGMNFQLTSAAMARAEFGRAAGAFGLLTSISAIGALVGSLVAARRTLPRVRGVVVGAFSFGAFSLLSALAPTYWVFAALSIPIGFSALTMITSANAAIQLRTEPSIRGRVMALYMMAFLGSTPVCAPLVGWIAEEWGPRWAIGLGGASSLLIAVVMAWWYFGYWRQDNTPTVVGRRSLGLGMRWVVSRLERNRAAD
ncbi:MFS transporter [Buchananella hordeovulneris]|uniref:MFS transporter n=1 Tax=Buchananella hordeovulneris TaxID=52770 RepID=UPI0026DAEA15|nr:MFS transporter [Buchananella hordeovulneris]MDO5081577.1 MFS transporter [Buchananella hordeovulneris]